MRLFFSWSTLIITLCCLDEYPVLNEAFKIKYFRQRRYYKLQQTNNNAIDASTQSEKVAEVIGLIVNAVDEGKLDELQASGMSVTKRPDKDVINENLKDDELVARLLGPMDQEHLDIMNAINLHQVVDSSTGYDFDADLEDIVIPNLDEMKGEVEKSLHELREQGFDMLQLLEDEDKISDSKYLWGPRIGTEQTLSPLPLSELPDAPPPFAQGANEEVTEIFDDDDDDESLDLQEKETEGLSTVAEGSNTESSAQPQWTESIEITVDQSVSTPSISRSTLQGVEELANQSILLDIQENNLVPVDSSLVGPETIESNVSLAVNPPALDAEVLQAQSETQLQFEQLLKVSVNVAEVGAGERSLSSIAPFES